MASEPDAATAALIAQMLREENPYEDADIYGIGDDDSDDCDYGSKRKKKRKNQSPGVHQKDLQKKNGRNMRRHIYHLEHGVNIASEEEAETDDTRKEKRRRDKLIKCQEYQWITFL